MVEQLLPCPHCGGEAALMDSWNMWTVYCKCCGCRTAKHSEQAEAGAIAAWNRRSPPESPDDSALRLGKAVGEWFRKGLWDVCALREMACLLRDGSPIPAEQLARLVDAIADNYPGKPESEEGKTQ